MIIVLKQHAPADKVQAFCNELNSMGFQINDSVGSDTHILGLIGDTKALAESWVLANPVVETCRRVSEPYKKANRKFHPDDTVVDVGGHKIGGGYFAVMSGPCSVESKEQITYVAQRVQAAGASILRGGAFKFSFGRVTQLYRWRSPCSSSRSIRHASTVVPTPCPWVPCAR